MEEQAKCLYCQQTSDETPLVNLTYLGKPLWICAQHLPMLIHKPHELAEHLENFRNQSNQQA